MCENIQARDLFDDVCLPLFHAMDLNASPTHPGSPAAPPPFSSEQESPVKVMDEKTPAGQPIVDREKVCVRPFASQPTWLTLPLTPDSTFSHTRICQNWPISPSEPIPRRASSNRGRVADIHVVRLLA